MKERSAFFTRSINRLHLILLLAMGIYMLMGGSTAYGYLGCLGVLAFFLRNELSLKDTFAAERRMTPFAFVLLLFVAQTLNFTHIVFNYAAETVLNTFGYTVGGFLHEEIKVWTYEKTPFHEVLLFGFLDLSLKKSSCGAISCVPISNTAAARSMQSSFQQSYSVSRMATFTLPFQLFLMLWYWDILPWNMASAGR